MSAQFPILALNRGNISRLALARLDLKRLAMASEINTNFMPRALGSTMLRPGLGYISTESGKTHLLEFVFAADDTALIELHDETVSFVAEGVRLTRPTVTAVINEPDFNPVNPSWTDQGGGGTTILGGGLSLIGSVTQIAAVYQQVAVVEPGVEHGLRLTVSRGILTLRIGSTLDGFDYVHDIDLGVGSHSIGFTPSAGSMFIRLFNSRTIRTYVDSVGFESGDVLIPSPWTEADLPMTREFQSGNVLFVADSVHELHRIVRHNTRSWSVEAYRPSDGPFLVENLSPTTLTASALTGQISIVASGSLDTGPFRSGHVGALFSLSSIGQAVTGAFSAQNQFTNSIRVTGVGAARNIGILIAGTFTATLTLQYSLDDATWVDRSTYTAVGSSTFNDALDNQIVYYRIGVKTGDYTSGTANADLTYATGSITGVVRVLTRTDSLNVTAEVLTDLGGTSATDIWAEGAWSNYRGWPSAVTILDGRLWWAGTDRFWGSIVDAYSSFDPNFEGDAGPVSRSIGFGPVDTINWLLPMDRLMAGTAGSELVCQSSAFDEPLTATNFTPKETSTQGSANIQALKIDDKAIFVQRCGTRVYELAASSSSAKFVPEDLTALNPEACEPGVSYMAVQRQPDTRIHFVLSDGTVAVLVFDKAENMICWVKVETDGLVEDVAVLPGTIEDSVYYVVKRTVNGADVRYLEKWALESEAQGATVNKQADSFVTYSGAATNTITGLGHLEGEEVIVWAGGVDKSPGVGAAQTTYTVSGGSITVPGATFTSAVVGLPYSARFKSTKLAYMVPPGKSGFGAKKKIGMLGLILADVHAKGLEYGPSFDVMDPMPETEAYEAVDQDAVREAYEEQLVEFPGEWSTDARLCLRATAPRPCTIMGVVVDMDTNYKRGL